MASGLRRMLALTGNSSTSPDVILRIRCGSALSGKPVGSGSQLTCTELRYCRSLVILERMYSSGWSKTSVDFGLSDVTFVGLGRAMAIADAE